MIRVQAAPEPDDFDAKVRQPGRRALLELIGDPSAPKRPGRPRKKVAQRIEEIPADDLPDYWTRSLPELRESYRHVCSYLGMRIHPSTASATVDHYRPKSKYQALTYEWSNYRLACCQVNACKGEHEDVLDPFEVEDGWFVLDVGTFEVRPAPDLGNEIRHKVDLTIRRLRLNEPTYRESRAEYHDRYLGLASPPPGADDAHLPLWWLEEECPYVAFELERQGLLRPDDMTRERRPS